MNGKTEIQVDLGERSYPIQVGQGWLSDLGPALREAFPGHRHVVITNAEIREAWGDRVTDCMAGAGLESASVVIPEGEEAKNLNTVSRIYDYLIENHYGRQTVLLALGGGVVGDVVGFAAATFLRGVGLVQLPTSLLAMVDSSVGGKTGVNHRLGKNLIGAFKQPRFVGIELDFLSTLPEAEYLSGLAEVVKYGMIADAGLFEYLENHVEEILGREPGSLEYIVGRSCEIKATIVAEDEFEDGMRAILNFGHTFGHAVETLTHYKRFRHGEAVAMGMMAACRLGTRTQNFPSSSSDRLESLLEGFGLPAWLPRLNTDEFLRAMRSDKKVRSGRMRFVIPAGIGQVTVRDDIEESEVRASLEASFERSSAGPKTDGDTKTNRRDE